MNRIASRAMIVLALVVALLAGTVFFVAEYAFESSDWVMTPGSPHVYRDDRVGKGVVTDRDDVLLLDTTDGKSFNSDARIRKAFLHWVGDREGNVQAGVLSQYGKELVGYDALSGTYQYGDAAGQMVLSIDASIQTAALEAMGSRKGTVAVYNYKTGEILCAVSTPTFDPKDPPDVENDNTGAYEGVYVNRFLRSKYIPGSIFKIVTLAAALECIPDIQEQTFTCNGSIDLEGGSVTCERTHGTQSLKDAFCNSCNCAFAQITLQVGKERMERYVEQFGLTNPLSFDGLTTVSGNYSVKDACEQEFAWSGIGQYTDQVNPCAYMQFMGAIAGGGITSQPHVVKEIKIGGRNSYLAQATESARIMSVSTAKILSEYMQNNVQAKYGADNFPGMTVCAKSGTGEVGGNKRPNAMFAGFVADTDLPLAFIVCIEEGGYGAQTCIPVLSEVLAACDEALN